jgi:3-oxoacyl-[acyl-carrier-protein] synthase-3
MHATISHIEYHLPEGRLTTRDLSTAFPEWPAAKIESKTGIRSRPIASTSECASDLAAAAAVKLFKSGVCKPEEIDFLVLCTQSPDYVLPTTACLLQDKLGIPKTAGALDFNLGCSGFVYGLGIAEGLIVSRQAERILLLTAETYSKYIGSYDKGSLAIFSDGAAATLLTCDEMDSSSMGPFIYGTDGRGGEHLIVRNSGARRAAPEKHEDGETIIDSETRQSLFMNGHEVFKFAIEIVPRSVKALLTKSETRIEDVDLFVFHQANAYILEEIRRICDIPREKLQITLDEYGNTVSSTIPIALKQAENDGRIKGGELIMVVGFGVGFSWAATLLRWNVRNDLIAR